MTLMPTRIGYLSNQKPDASMIRIFIIDDQSSFRKHMRSLVAFLGMTVAGEAGSIREALAKLPAANPDLAVVDVDMPGINGIDGTILIKKACPQLRVILVSIYSDQSSLYEKAARSVGAEAFVSKDRLDTAVIKGWDTPRTM